MTTTTIRPGLLVSLHTSVSGGVSYTRTDLDVAPSDVADPDRDAKRAVSRWETKRMIEDPAEHERATKARGKAQSEIRAVCCKTAFGLLCPIEDEPALDAAIARAREIVDAFNAGATFTRISLYTMRGRIASTDEEAARAIGSEVASLVSKMNGAIDRLDPDAIRAAATEAKQMIALMGEEQQGVIQGAIDQARKAARQIVSRIQKDGEAAEIVLKDVQRGAIERARIAFLDLDDAPAAAPALPSIEAQRFADLEITGEGN